MYKCFIAKAWRALTNSNHVTLTTAPLCPASLQASESKTDHPFEIYSPFGRAPPPPLIITVVALCHP